MLERIFGSNSKVESEFGRGKIAVVTGGNSGIGLAIAKKLSSMGYTVPLIARREDMLRAAANLIAKNGESENLVYKLDVRDEKAVKDVFDLIKSRFGTPDILVNNAGFNNFLRFSKENLLSHHEVADTIFYGALNCIAYSGILEAGKGIIANILSEAGKNPCQLHSVYGGVKEGLGKACISIAAEYPGVQIINFVGGVFNTPFYNQAFERGFPKRTFERYALDPKKFADAFGHAIMNPKGEVYVPVYLKLGEIVKVIAPGLVRHVVNKNTKPLNYKEFILQKEK